MFIVKAVRLINNTRPVGYDAAESYSVFQCDYYIVAPSTRNGTSAPGEAPYVPPELEIELYEKSHSGAPDSQVGCILVGAQYGYFNTVYIMNEKGKTIDTVEAQLS